MNNVWLMSLVSFFTDMGTYMVTPLIPIILASSGPMIIGIIDGLTDSLASVLKFYSGRHSDRLNKRKGLAIAGYGLSGLGRVFLFLPPNWLGIFLWKLIDRTGKGIRTAPRDALISESGGKGKQGRTFGVHQMLDMLGCALGIGAAYLIIRLEGINSIPKIFLFSIIPVVIGWLLIFTVKEKKPEQHQIISTIQSEQERLNWKDLNPIVKKLLAVVLLFTIVNSSNSFLLLRASDIGVSTANVLLLYLLFNLTASLLSYLSGAFSDRFGRKGILTVGYVVYGLVYIGFAKVHAFSGLLILFVVYGLYSALTKGVEKALVADMASPKAKGTALGFYAMVTGIGLFPASLLTGSLWTIFGPETTFYLNGFLAIIAAIFLFFILPDR